MDLTFSISSSQQSFLCLVWDTERTLLWVCRVFASMGMGFMAVTPVLSLNDFTSISPWSLSDNQNTLLLFIYWWLSTSLSFPGCACPLLLPLVPVAEGAVTSPSEPNLPLCLGAFLTPSLQLLQSKQDDLCCANRTFQFATKSPGSWGGALRQGWSSQPRGFSCPLGCVYIKNLVKTPHLTFIFLLFILGSGSRL